MPDPAIPLASLQNDPALAQMMTHQGPQPPLSPGANIALQLMNMPINLAKGVATIPQRFMEAGQGLTNPYAYGPVSDTDSAFDRATQAANEAAGTSMTGGLAGVPMRAGETVLGHGPVISKPMFDPETGMLSGPSPAFNKASQAAKAEIAAGPKGAGPLDLSNLAQIPDVPQTAIPRFVPPKGTSARMADAMQNPDVINGIADSMRKGVDLGAAPWYHTQAIRQAFIDNLGPEEGPQRFGKYMDLVAATSPRSDVGTNIRNASYYYGHSVNDTPLPEKAPFPYGHIAQNLHRQNYDTVQSTGGWDPMQNPKPASFSQNLQGNLQPVTVDTHAFRNIGMRTGDPRFLSGAMNVPAATDPTSMAVRFGQPTSRPDFVSINPKKLYNEGKLSLEEAQTQPAFWASQPEKNEYGDAEALYQHVGKHLGMAPADAQAAAWSGGGELTGLGSPATHTFPELFNERVAYTSKLRGEDPKQTLADFIKGKKPLLGLGAAAAGTALQGQPPLSTLPNMEGQ